MLRYCLRDIVGDVHRSTSSVCLRYLLREFEVRAWSRIGYGDTCVSGFNDDLLLARQSYLNLQGEKWEFLARGYTVDAPLRRGRSESTGTFVEECSEYANPCTAAEQATITDRSIKEALLHTDAVPDQLVLGRIVARDSKILAVGHSRGGFLSLLLAGQRPQAVKAQELVRAWLDAGGKADFVYVTTHSLENAHALPSSPVLWSRHVDTFLKSINQ